MPDPNVALIRHAYAGYVRGDTAAVLDLVDPDLEWTYLDPSAADPRPQVCHGRGELAAALAQQAERGLLSQLEEVIGHGDKVVVTVRTPGADAYRVRQSDDRDYAVFTVWGGRIVALHDCLNRGDALRLAGIDEHP
jgi:ketosteroid isomerase-like protein